MDKKDRSRRTSFLRGNMVLLKKRQLEAEPELQPQAGPVISQHSAEEVSYLLLLRSRLISAIESLHELAKHRAGSNVHKFPTQPNAKKKGCVKCKPKHSAMARRDHVQSA